MKKLSMIMLPLLSMIMLLPLGILCGCKETRPEQQTIDLSEAESSGCENTGPEPQIRNLSEADFAARMEGYYLEFMGANYTAVFGVNWIDITPDDVYEKIGCQIFKDGVNCQSFLTYQGEIYALPGFFGGYGIMSLHACDFNNSGSYDLIFTTSWGSGMHRSEIWVFDFSRLEPQIIKGMIADEDIVLRKVNDQKFDIISAKLDNTKTRLGGYANLSIFVPDRRIGTVELRDGTPVFFRIFKELPYLEEGVQR